MEYPCQHVTLDCIERGQKARVLQLQTTGSMRCRLQDIGLIEGSCVECVQRSPSGDPIAYLIRGAVIALRKKDCADIVVEIF